MPQKYNTKKKLYSKNKKEKDKLEEKKLAKKRRKSIKYP